MVFTNKIHKKKLNRRDDMTCKCKPISFFEVSHGTHNASLADGREILIRALLCGAANIIIVHNHPSGVPEPSREDMLLLTS